MIQRAGRGRVSDDAAERIRELVAEWGIEPGDRLPPERDLAVRLGVGRTSVREGLRSLEVMGVVEIRPSRGVFLKGDAAAPLNGFIRSWLSAHRGSLQALVELREALETQAAALAASRADGDDFHAMRKALSAQRAAFDGDDHTAFVEADDAFHDAIARAAGNGLLRRALTSVAQEIRVYKLATARIGVEARRRPLADHAAVIAAIEAGDVAAAREAMRTHIVQTPLDIGVLAEDAPASPPDDGAASQEQGKERTTR
jgi:GntR family transcriptional repressor for pyruvate dehydrogenase complex